MTKCPASPIGSSRSFQAGILLGIAGAALIALVKELLDSTIVWPYRRSLTDPQPGHHDDEAGASRRYTVRKLRRGPL
jgi:hypothetical protein